jgi:hypothetical protein
MTRILRGLLLNLKIYRALKYILLNSLRVDPPHIHTKIKVFCYVDKKCKIPTHSYHPRGSSIYVIGPIR